MQIAYLWIFAEKTKFSKQEDDYKSAICERINWKWNEKGIIFWEWAMCSIIIIIIESGRNWNWDWEIYRNKSRNEILIIEKWDEENEINSQLTFAICSRTELRVKSEEQFSALFTYAQSHNRDTPLVEEKKKKNGENGNGKRKGRSEIRFAARGKGSEGREGEAHEIQLNMAMGWRREVAERMKGRVTDEWPAKRIRQFAVLWSC